MEKQTNRGDLRMSLREVQVLLMRAVQRSTELVNLNAAELNDLAADKTSKSKLGYCLRIQKHQTAPFS